MEAKLRLVVLLSIILIGCGAHEYKCDDNPDACPSPIYEGWEVHDMEPFETTVGEYNSLTDKREETEILAEAFSIYCDSDNSKITIYQGKYGSFSTYIWDSQMHEWPDIDAAAKAVCNPDNYDKYVHHKRPDIDFEDLSFDPPAEVLELVDKLISIGVKEIIRQKDELPELKILRNKYGLAYMKFLNHPSTPIAFMFTSYIILDGKAWSTKQFNSWIHDNISMKLDQYGENLE